MSLMVLANQITMIFLNLGLLTTLSFDSEIVSYMYGGGAEEVYFKVANKNRTLVIKPTLKADYSNLLVVTSDAKYYFDLRSSEARPHQFVEIRRGQINKAMKIILETSKFKLLEGDASILIVNKTNGVLKVNEFEVKRKLYLGKGIPVFVDGIRILN